MFTRVLLILVAALLGFTYQTPTDQLSLDLRIGSEESVWKPIAGRLEAKFKPMEPSAYNVFEKYIILGNDSVLCQYKLNHPLRSGHLRKIRIEVLRSVNRIPNCSEIGNIGFAPGFRDHALEMQHVKSLIRKMIKLYGNPTSISNKIDYSISTRTLRVLTWQSGGTVSTLAHSQPEVSKCFNDSIARRVFVELRTSDYDKVYAEDLGKFKAQTRKTDVFQLSFRDPKLEVDNTGQQYLVQDYSSLVHAPMGYDVPIESAKFDVAYVDSFRDTLITIPEMLINFQEGVPMGLMKSLLNSQMGFKIELSKKYYDELYHKLNTPGFNIHPAVKRLVIKYENGDLWK
ncbi:MAG: hypothetical protein JST46_17735 [Bacteroidetes bacterium]|nr:hypothetical protein [Bacteroidota bacterium]